MGKGKKELDLGLSQLRQVERKDAQIEVADVRADKCVHDNNASGDGRIADNTTMISFRIDIETASMFEVLARDIHDSDVSKCLREAVKKEVDANKDRILKVKSAIEQAKK